MKISHTISSDAQAPKAPAGTPRQAEPLSQYRRHPCLAALPFQPLQAFPYPGSSQPPTHSVEYRQSPTGFHAGLEHAPPQHRRWPEGRKKAHALSRKRWPGAGEGCRAAPASKGKDKKGKENELKREPGKRQCLQGS